MKKRLPVVDSIQFRSLQLLRTYKLEYNYKPLKYAVTFMYAPDGPLKFKMTRRED